jgi:2-polyprenyl-3-methyl-5-hydroxy-6-metoxy-1,4-benzoquinol methylase
MNNLSSIDPTLFKGTAFYYSRYRPNIHNSVIKYLKKRFELNNKGRLLDIGCGTGQLTYSLARYFEKVVAIDPDKGMIREAKRLNLTRKYNNFKNISWRIKNADEVSTLKGKFKLVTFSRAFHWVNQYSILEKLKNKFGTEGGVAIIGDGSFWTGDEDWQLAVKKVVKKYLGDQRRAGTGKYKTTDEPYEDILKKCDYNNIECVNFEVIRKWTYESIKGWLYSSSFASRELLGENCNDFELDLKNTLTSLDNSGIYLERTSFSVKSGFYINHAK